MPIVKTLDSSTLDLNMFHDADVIRVGEAYARLVSFMSSDVSVDTFACDLGTYSAIRRAAARVVNAPRDKVLTYVSVKRTVNGKTVWKRLKRDQTAKSNDTTRETTVKTYTSDAVRESIATLRDSHGIAIKRQTERYTIDGVEYLVVALVRQPVVAAS
jgi:hypothetical protein